MANTYNITSPPLPAQARFPIIQIDDIKRKQAGAELYQAQFKLETYFALDLKMIIDAILLNCNTCLIHVAVIPL